MRKIRYRCAMGSFPFRRRSVQFCIVTGTIGAVIACSISSVTHDATMDAGSSMVARINIEGTGSNSFTDNGTHFACVGLKGGWKAANIGWGITSGTGAPATGSGTNDPTEGAARDAADPDYAPWACFSMTGVTTADDSDGYADIEVFAPRCARGDHEFKWYYRGTPASGSTDTEVTTVTVNPLPTAYELVAEPPGIYCAHGGTRLNAGCDADEDGLPDTDVKATFVCNDAPTLVSVEDAGSRCPNGGQRIATGSDDGADSGIEGNGILEPGEADSPVHYVCNGEDGVDGVDGTDGMNGRDGGAGVNGQDGMDGENGQDGIDGQPGTNGEDGQNGQDGENGQNGVRGDSGADGEDGEDGTNGEGGGCTLGQHPNNRSTLPALLVLLAALLGQRRRMTAR